MKRFQILIISLLMLLAFYPAFSLAANPTEFKLGIMTSFTGPFAAVAETQKQGVLLAVDQINKKGGLSMPWGKVKVTTIIADDEQKLDVGVRRFRELVAQGINGLVGQVWNPLAMAINEEAKITPIPYFPICVPALKSFEKGNMAEATFSVAFTPWSIGYLSGDAVINTLKKKRIFYLSRSDLWGSTIYDGLKVAVKKFGGEIVGDAELPVGTVDFTAVINKVKAAKPDVFISAQFGGDAIALLKQSYELGLYNETTMFNTWITNVVAKGIPPKALAGLYALQYFYWDMTGFADKKLVESAKEYSTAYREKWGTPPDAYATIAYVATDLLFKGVEKAGSFDAKKVNKAVMETREFQTVKGPVSFRKDHEMVSKYAAFMVKGKAPEEKKGEWDFFKVMGYYGGDEVLPSLQSLGF